MAKSVCVLLDDEQESLLKNILRARRDKCASRIIREALWCYAEKILSSVTTNVVVSEYKNTTERKDQ